MSTSAEVGAGCAAHKAVAMVARAVAALIYSSFSALCLRRNHYCFFSASFNSFTCEPRVAVNPPDLQLGDGRRIAGEEHSSKIVQHRLWRSQLC